MINNQILSKECNQQTFAVRESELDKRVINKETANEVKLSKY